MVRSLSDNMRTAGPSSHRWLVLAMAMGLVLLVQVSPASAAVSAPGSASVLPGGATSVTATTDASTIGVSGGAGGISVAPSSGSGPNVRFSFTVGTSVAPGTYGYTFFDDAGGTSSFTLIVDSPPATTTTSTTSTTTTTTSPPAATTTTRPTTTTTRPTTTTTTTSTTSTTTTTVPTTTTSTTSTTTTTTAPTTTTTAPTTTTTSTLVPAGIVALGDSEGGGGALGGPFVWFGGGAVLLALALAGGYTLWSRRQPTYGAATPGFILAWSQRRERHKVQRTSHGSRRASFGTWWKTSGPVVNYQEWRGSRDAAKTVRRQIEDRKRLRRQGE